MHTDNNIGFARFSFNDVGVVEIGDHNANVGVFLLELVAFVLGTDEQGIFVVWLLAVKCVKDVSTDVTRGSRTKF